MDFQILRQVVNSINQTIVNTGVSAVKNLKSNLFEVKVTNPVTKVDVKGQVTVANQKNVEQLIKDLRKTTVEFSKKTHEVKVVNHQTPQSLNGLELNIKEVSKTIEKLIPELKNVAKEAKSAKTDKVSIINQPISELKAVLEALKSLDLKVKGLKLDPKIEVKAPIIPAPIVNVAPTPVTVEKDEFDYEQMGNIFDRVLHAKNASKYVPVRLSDGKLFYEAIQGITSGISANRKVESTLRAEDFDHPGTFQYVQGAYDTLGRFVLLTNASPAVASEDYYQLRKVDIDANTSYIGTSPPGTATSAAGWQIKKKFVDGTDTVINFADGVSTFDKVWDDRATYTY